jgi:oxygen-independent coproporphyrinogen-3 oxidase
MIIMKEKWRDLKIIASELLKDSQNLNCNPSYYDYVYGYPPLSMLKSNKRLNISDDLIANIGIYIHIPFCNNLCNYCYFVKSKCKNNIKEYLDVLLLEMKNYSLLLKRYKIEYIYFGGGTPSILDIGHIDMLLNALNKYFNISPKAEISFEFSPETNSEQKLQYLLRAGINRISIGVQTFNEAILKNMKRPYNSKIITESLELALKYYPNKMNIDLIYGYPDSKISDLFNDLNRSILLSIPSITTYQIWTRIKTQLKKKCHTSYLEILKNKLLINNTMLSGNYKRDMVDWYVKTEESKFQFQRHKWNNNYFVGFGVSSYAYINNVYYRNNCNYLDYIASVKSTGSGVYKSFELNQEDVTRRKIVLGIKTNEGFDAKIINDLDYEQRVEVRSTINKLENIGVVERTKGLLKLSDNGKYFADQICEQFYSRQAVLLSKINSKY